MQMQRRKRTQIHIIPGCARAFEGRGRIRRLFSIFGVAASPSRPPRFCIHQARCITGSVASASRILEPPPCTRPTGRCLITDRYYILTCIYALRHVSRDAPPALYDRRRSARVLASVMWAESAAVAGRSARRITRALACGDLVGARRGLFARTWCFGDRERRLYCALTCVLAVPGTQVNPWLTYCAAALHCYARRPKKGSPTISPRRRFSSDSPRFPSFPSFPFLSAPRPLPSALG